MMALEEKLEDKWSGLIETQPVCMQRFIKAVKHTHPHIHPIPTESLCFSRAFKKKRAWKHQIQA